MVGGQVNLTDAIERHDRVHEQGGKQYQPERRGRDAARAPARLAPHRAGTSRVDGEPMAGALMDFGLYFFHNAQRLLEKGSGPYFYLPKMESHLEARLWNDVFTFARGASSASRTARSGRRC